MVITKETIMEQAQVFASGWSLVGGIFDNGHALEDAEELKDELGGMVGALVKQRDELLAVIETEHGGIHFEPECAICEVVDRVKGGV